MTSPDSTSGKVSAGKWPSGVNVLAGIWLILAPAVLGYTGLDQAVWNDRVVGVAVFILAMARIAAPVRFEVISWINFVLGAWLVVAPFLLAYTVVGDPAGATGSPSAAVANDIIVGILIIAMAVWSARAGGVAGAPHPGRADVNTAQHATSAARRDPSS